MPGVLAVSLCLVLQGLVVWVARGEADPLWFPLLAFDILVNVQMLKLTGRQLARMSTHKSSRRQRAVDEIRLIVVFAEIGLTMIATTGAALLSSVLAFLCSSHGEEAMCAALRSATFPGAIGALALGFGLIGLHGAKRLWQVRLPCWLMLQPN